LTLPAWTPSQAKGQGGLNPRVQKWQDEGQVLSYRAIKEPVGPYQGLLSHFFPIVHGLYISATSKLKVGCFLSYEK